MSESDELTLENCWVIPKSDIFYLEEGYINAELKNNSCSSIIIVGAVCRFQTEEGLIPYEAHAVKSVIVESGNRVTLHIPFVAELHLTSNTNVFSFSISYKCRESDKVVTFPVRPPPVQNSVIIYPSRQSVKYFFISHKIPEDTALATKLDHYLQKIGFRGFLAEANPRPGLDIWSDKIVPAIKNDNCIGLIMLWTSKAATGPSAIIRELRHAQDCGKKQMLLVEDDLRLPDAFPNSKEYQQSLDAAVTEIDLIRLVKSIERTYRNGIL